jgi:hypothetical protein
MARMKSIDKLTLKEMIFQFHLYSGLPEGLLQLPVPEYITIKNKKFTVPKDMDELTSNICYGQRLFIVRKEDIDFGLIIRTIEGYYYSKYTMQKWDEEKALLFGKKVITCKVKEIYPVAMHISKLISEMADREQKLLYREPTKVELAAGIEKLNVFSELTALDFLRDAMKCTVAEVLQTPYNECLVRFMLAKEINEFQERYLQLINEKSEKPKSKYIK